MSFLYISPFVQTRDSKSGFRVRVLQLWRVEDKRTTYTKVKEQRENAPIDPCAEDPTFDILLVPWRLCGLGDSTHSHGPFCRGQFCAAQFTQSEERPLSNLGRRYANQWRYRYIFTLQICCFRSKLGRVRSKNEIRFCTFCLSPFCKN